MEQVKMQKAMIMAIIMATISFSSVFAANITVGGSNGWNLTTNLTLWSSFTPIYVNDTLLFKYNTRVYDVLEVSEQDFLSCQISSPLQAYSNGDDTVILLTRSGVRYFICGRSNHCNLGLKLQVHVLHPPEPNHPDPTPAKQPNRTEPGLQKSDACRNVITRFLYVILVTAIICWYFDMPDLSRPSAYLTFSVGTVLYCRRFIDSLLDIVHGPTRELRHPTNTICYLYFGAMRFASLFFYDINEAILSSMVVVGCFLLVVELIKSILHVHAPNQSRQTPCKQSNPGTLKTICRDATIGLLHLITLATIISLYYKEVPTFDRLSVDLRYSVGFALYLHGLCKVLLVLIHVCVYLIKKRD